MSRKIFENMEKKKQPKKHVVLKITLSDLMKSFERASKASVSEIELKSHLLTTCERVNGLKTSVEPFNCHKDLMKRFLEEVFKVQKNANMPKSTKPAVAFEPAVRIILVKAMGLPPMDADGTCDPYVRVRISGSKGKPYVSEHRENTLNPTWHEMLSIELTKQELNSDREVIAEVWDKDPKNFSEMCRDLGGVKSIRGVWHGLKDIMELVLSYIFRIEVDDLVGTASVPLKKIPAVGTEEIQPLKSSNGKACGHIHLALTWGRNPATSVDAQLKHVELHFILYKHLFVWHLQQTANEEAKGRSCFPDIEQLNYRIFMFMPAITVMNQHRLQGNISHYEDGVIRRAVLCEILQSTPEPRGKLMLVAILCNEDITEPQHVQWDSTDHRATLNAAESGIFLNLIKHYLPRIKLTTLLASLKTVETYELMMFLRLVSQYNRKHLNAGFEKLVNQDLSNKMVEHLSTAVKDSSQWEAVIQQLNDLEDKFEKYWSQNVSSVLGESGRQEFSNVFQAAIKKQVEVYRTNYESEPEKYGDVLLRSYFFLKNLDFIVGGCSTGAVMQKITTETHNASQAKVFFQDDHASCGILGEFKGLDSKVTAKGVDGLFSLLPQWAKGIPSIELKSNVRKTPSINLHKLELGEISRAKTKEYNMGYRQLVPLEVLKKELLQRRDKCKNFMKIVIAEDIKALKEEQQPEKPVDGVQKKERGIERFFYKVLGDTVYFFMELQWWDEAFLKEAIQTCLDLIKEYCQTYSLRLIQQANEMDASKNSLASLLASGINDIFRIREVQLRKQLVESLTDKNASEIWSAIMPFLPSLENVGGMAKSTAKDANKSETENVLESNEQFKNLPPSAQGVIRICVAIDEVAGHTSDAEKQLSDALAKMTVIHSREKVRQEIEAPITKATGVLEGVRKVSEILKKDVQAMVSRVESPESKINMMLFSLKNMDTCFRKWFTELHAVFLKTKTLKNKSAKTQLTKLQILKLDHVVNEYCTALKTLADGIIAERSLPFDFNDALSSMFSETDEYQKKLAEVHNWQLTK